MIEFLAPHLNWFGDPTAWVALLTLVVLEIVLGIDNLIFISILTNKLPESQRASARRLGIGAALVLRLVLLATISIIVQLTNPLFEVAGHGFSWRDLILIAGGLFLVWKATKEIHHSVDPEPDGGVLDKKAASTTEQAATNVSAIIVQIIALDVIFSIDSILTAVGMTDDLPIMVVAVILAVGLMLVAADPLGNFINANPSVVMLALGFLLMIGAVLIGEAFGAHVPKGYIYAAMAFSGFIEGLNLTAARRRKKNATQDAKDTP